MRPEIMIVESGPEQDARHERLRFPDQEYAGIIS
jgi:hypothetical protein